MYSSPSPHFDPGLASECVHCRATSCPLSQSLLAVAYVSMLYHTMEAALPSVPPVLV